jgi:hypothetical protein
VFLLDWQSLFNSTAVKIDWHGTLALTSQHVTCFCGCPRVMQGDGGNTSIDYVLAIYERLSLLLFVTEHHVVDWFRSQSPFFDLVYGDVQTTHRIVVL